MKELTIIGATGKLAIPTIQRLLHNGVNVKAIVRNIEKAQNSLPEKVEIVKGDLKDVDSLKSALQGTKYLYLNLSTEEGPGADFYPEHEGVANIIEAAKGSNIAQIIQISGLGALHPEFNLKGKVFHPNTVRHLGYELIKKTGIPHTVLYCTWFLNSLPWFEKDDKYQLVGSHEYPLYWINTTDFADQLTNTIGNKNTYNQHYAIQGKEGLNFRQAAKEYIRIINPQLQIQEMPITPELGGLAELMNYFEDFDEKLVAEKAWNDLGEPKLSVAEFLETLK